ncbi:MAG: zinc-binding dehydrogenase [Deltaproteobacteria bacterium]|nr:zinc-binding dehydrogenase [Deltaproteobacteria bacterium]
MRAYVLSSPGGPEALQLREIPTPEAVPGRVLIKVRAFGLNRSEWFTRNGDSPSVTLPRVLGIECVGTVVAAPGTPFSEGETVAALMGGMGRQYDGSYAEYTSVPAEHVLPVRTELPWQQLGAIPEMLQTVAGSLHLALEIERASTLLVRGGTSSIGLTATLLAKSAGLTVAATTRNPAKADFLREHGADHVVIETGTIAADVRDVFPGGVDRVLELIGTRTLLDSLHATRPGGIVCMTGILGNSWTLDGFNPMTAIPTGVKLTAYSGGSGDLTVAQLQGFVDAVQSGKLAIRIAKVWDFEQLVEAHQAMDDGTYSGKMVVVV